MVRTLYGFRLIGLGTLGSGAPTRRLAAQAKAGLGKARISFL